MAVTVSFVMSVTVISMVRVCSVLIGGWDFAGASTGGSLLCGGVVVLSG